MHNQTVSRITVDQYERMIENHILGEDDRVELIRGEIVPKMAIGERHASRVNRLARLLIRKAGNHASISIQNPLVLADSEPEPDLMVLQYRADDYENAKPVDADVLLVIEVADSSIDFDRDIKGPLYAENGIPEYWLVNLNSNHVEVFRQPVAGQYTDRSIARPGDMLPVPGGSIAVAELL